MEQKTKVDAHEGKQDLLITRDFDLPVELLFKAYSEPELVEQWMGTKVLKLENKKHGSYQFETTDPNGNKYRFNGAIHEFSQDKKIIRTFEFENMPFGVQLEVLEFELKSNETSRLSIHTIFESAEKRDNMLKMPFTQGINMAHNRMEEILSKIINK
jgi:uncharacterized protein YndB with AHSA1/START domain